MGKMAIASQETVFVTPAAALAATLTVGPASRGLVVFAHGSGSGRFSPRNRAVADVLHGEGLGTLLLDLLTEDEQRVDEVTREHRFNIELLAQRVVAAIDAAGQRPQTAGLPIGLFGASTGAAAALAAAGRRPAAVKAVVSRGGRGDLAAKDLPNVRAAVLLIVGGRDPEILLLNRQVQSMLQCPNELVIVPGAGHLFEESDTLYQAARHAAEWFSRNLVLAAGEE
jgi:pimeloyl-ACP methyl ester carboxylesterase